jgi:serine protease Do
MGSFYPFGRGVLLAVPSPRFTTKGSDMVVTRVLRCAVILLAATAVTVPPAAAQPAQSKTAPAGTDLRQISRTLQALSDRVGPAVVQVFAVGYAQPSDPSEERSLLAQQRSTGSGVILDAEGYIVTNAHVVQGAYKVQVQMPAPRRGAARSIVGPRPRVIGAQIVAIDEETDLSVLKVDEKALPFLELADSDSVRSGQLVLAFGSPLGLDSSVTLGVVSAVARQLEPDDPMIYIQTDASINPGNSGGPLVDTDGRVVGINTLILSQSGGNEGLGFAAPSNIVRNIFDQVRKYGRVRRGEIGVRAQTITPALAEGLNLPRDWGVVLGDVNPAGPAAKAGIEPGDIVAALDGKPMENGRQLQVNLYGRGIGDVVTLQILRGTRTVDVPVTVIERGDDPNRFAGMVRPEEHLIKRLGVLALTFSRQLAQLLPDVRVASGVVVAAAARTGAPGWEGELQPGDVIHAVNRTLVTDVATLRTAVDTLKVGQALVLHVEREGELLFLGGRVE